MRVVVAEDSLLFREGLVRLLSEKGHDVVGTADDAPSLLAAVQRHSPDLAVVDVRMPPLMESDGAEAAATLRRTHPDVGLLLLSQHVELRHVLPLIGAPGFGYLLKDRVLDLADFLGAVDRVGSGGSALDPTVVQALVRARAGSALDALSERELIVLGLVAEGLSNGAIADRLAVSARTVEAHIRSVFLKLGLPEENTNRRVLAVLAYLEAH